MTLLTAALVETRHGWSAIATLVLFCAATLMLGGFAALELRSRRPRLDPHLLTQPRFLASISGALFTGLAVVGLMSYAPALMQQALQFLGLRSRPGRALRRRHVRQLATIATPTAANPAASSPRWNIGRLLSTRRLKAARVAAAAQHAMARTAARLPEMRPMTVCGTVRAVSAAAAESLGLANGPAGVGTRTESAPIAILSRAGVRISDALALIGESVTNGELLGWPPRSPGRRSRPAGCQRACRCDPQLLVTKHPDRCRRRVRPV